MLPRGLRLPREEFHARGYQKIATPYFSVKAKPNATEKSRLGIVLGAATVKGAARRNFWRRQAKSVFLSALTALKAKGIDLLIIFAPHAILPSKRVFRTTLRDAIISLTSRS